MSPLAIAGLVAAVAGFVLTLSYHTSRTVNGVRTECDYHDYGPLLVGPVVLVLGIVTLVRSGRPGHTPRHELAVGAACLALGTFHLLRGLGIVVIDFTGNNPC